LKNVFFDIALNRAARLSGKAGRIMLLVGQLANKMLKVDWSKVTVATAKERLSIFSRLAQAYATGDYKAVPWKAVMTALAAIIYFLNPIDLIPDFIPGLGLTDDFSILLWVYNSISTEVDKFLEWEKNTLQVK
jgi:uncharacterized membrane protein YkvA (DUF1232 family)